MGMGIATGLWGKDEKQIPRGLKPARDDKTKGAHNGVPFGKLRAGSKGTLLRSATTVRACSSGGRHFFFFFAGFDFVAGCNGGAVSGFAAFILPWRMARRSASQSFTVWFA